VYIARGLLNRAAKASILVGCGGIALAGIAAALLQLRRGWSERARAEAARIRIYPGEPPGMNEEGDQLRARLTALDAELASTGERIIAAETVERDAFDHHDKAALDAAWQEHDLQLARLQTLQDEREQVWQRLVQQAAAWAADWRARAEAELQRWRTEAADGVSQMLRRLEEVDELLSRVQQEPELQARQRQQLDEELLKFREQGLPVEVHVPEMDWSVPAADLRPVADQLRRLSERVLTIP
jgi:chromosome segregation ATPase